MWEHIFHISISNHINAFNGLVSGLASSLVRSGIPLTSLLIRRHGLQLGNSPSAIFNLGRYSSVGIATRFGDRILLGARYSAPVQTGPGAHPASYTFGTGSFPEVKRPGHSFDHPSPSSAKVKGRVEVYIYSPSGRSWPVLGLILPLHSPYLIWH